MAVVVKSTRINDVVQQHQPAPAPTPAAVYYLSSTNSLEHLARFLYDFPTSTAAATIHMNETEVKEPDIAFATTSIATTTISTYYHRYLGNRTRTKDLTLRRFTRSLRATLVDVIFTQLLRGRILIYVKAKIFRPKQ